MCLVTFWTFLGRPLGNFIKNISGITSGHPVPFAYFVASKGKAANSVFNEQVVNYSYNNILYTS
jgi:hypothetical protein